MFNKLISLKTDKKEEIKEERKVVFQEKKSSLKDRIKYFNKNIYKLKNKTKSLYVSANLDSCITDDLHIEMKAIPENEIRCYTNYNGNHLELNCNEIFEIEEKTGEDEKLVLNFIGSLKHSKIIIEYPYFIDQFTFCGSLNVNFRDITKIHSLNLEGNSICHLNKIRSNFIRFWLKDSSMLFLEKIENNISLYEESTIIISATDDSICSIGEKEENKENSTFKGYQFADFSFYKNSKLYVNNTLNLKHIIVLSTNSSMVQMHKIKTECLNLTAREKSRFNIKEDSVADSLFLKKSGASEANLEKMYGDGFSICDERFLSFPRLKNMPYKNFKKVNYYRV